MNVQCIATITTNDKGYVSGVTVEPVPGVRFNFTADDGKPLRDGKYDVVGVLSRFDGKSRAGADFVSLNVRGAAYAVQGGYQRVKA